MATLINSDPCLTSAWFTDFASFDDGRSNMYPYNVVYIKTLENSRSLDKNANNLQYHNITFYLLKYFKLHQIYTHIYLLVDLHDEIISSEVCYRN